ncbi:hypothetical protein JCM10908_007083 [Rhodotorula pacifica]|uniref:uncharacterized protein n=1 Tax=Rhodotorula pacifica TaxID=1495444 RepID=UPI00317F4889
MDRANAHTARETTATAPISKRKLLDSLASLDAATRDPLSAGPGAAKRRRTKTPHSTSTPALEAILARTARPSKPSEAPPPASYQPTSLPALLERIATYRLTTFSPSKPPSLSALACALHGWVHTPSTRERIQCVTCGNGMVLLPPSAGDGAWSSPAGQRLRQEYERQVSDRGQAHAETCPWRLRPCAKSLYRLPGGGLGVTSGGRRRLLEELGRDARTLDQAGLGDVRLELPEVVRDVLEKQDKQERLVKAVTSVAESASSSEASPPANSDLPSPTSILLSIFGWELVTTARVPPLSTTPSLAQSTSASSLSSLSESSSPILTCKYCTRHVLMSSYLSTAKGEKRFDPVRQHQAFCPFVDGQTDVPDSTTSSRSGARPETAVVARKPGWLIRLEAVLPGQGGAASTDTGAAASEGTASTTFAAPNSHELLSYVRKLLGPKSVAKSRVDPQSFKVIS